MRKVPLFLRVLSLRSFFFFLLNSNEVPPPPCNHNSSEEFKDTFVHHHERKAVLKDDVVTVRVVYIPGCSTITWAKDDKKTGKRVWISERAFSGIHGKLAPAWSLWEEDQIVEIVSASFVPFDGGGGGAGAGTVAGTPGSSSLPPGLRWDLPLAIFDSILDAVDNLHFSKDAKARDASLYKKRVASILSRGKGERVVQFIPHVTLLADASGERSVAGELTSLTATFVVDWIENNKLVRWNPGFEDGSVAAPITSRDLLDYVTLPEGMAWHLKNEFDAALAPATLQLLTLG